MTGDPEKLRTEVWRPPAGEIGPVLGWGARLRAVAVGLAGLFIPGSGQLINRSYTRAAIVFGVWVAAWITHLRPVWISCLVYSAIEAAVASVRMSRKAQASTVAAQTHETTDPRD